MLIAPHALHCVDSCFFVFTSFDTVWHTVLVSVPPPPPPPLHQNFFIRFSFFVKIHLLLTRKLTVRVVGLPPPPLPRILFIRFSFGPLFTASNFQCRGVLLIWIIVGQGPIALAIGAGGGLFGHFFSHLSLPFSFSLSLGAGLI